jgi:hypothetical protein
VSASDKTFSDNRNAEGSILILAMLIVIIMGIFVGAITLRLNTIIKNQASIDYRKNLVEWARALSERIDCVRVMNPYTASNICPSGTARPLVFFNEPALAPTGPESSYPIGKDWFAQVTCGSADLRIKIARYSNGQFNRDPLTNRIMNFSAGGSQISDGGYEIPMCPSYFGDGQPSVRVLGMSKATNMKLVVENTLTPTGILRYIDQECDGQIGMVAQLDDTPLPTFFRAGGTSASDTAPRSETANMFYNSWRATFDAWGQTGNLQPDWRTPSPRSLGGHNRGDCNLICILHGMTSGILTKCDGTISGNDPPLGQTRWDDTSPQVNCTCIK